jgi:archaellum component FlaC
VSDTEEDNAFRMGKLAVEIDRLKERCETYREEREAARDEVERLRKVEDKLHREIRLLKAQLAEESQAVARIADERDELARAVEAQASVILRREEKAKELEKPKLPRCPDCGKPWPTRVG